MADITYVYPRRSQLIMIALYFAAYGLLTAALNTYIVPIYGYSGFQWYPNALKFAEAAIALIALCFWLPVKLVKPSDLLLHFLLLFPILPMLVLFAGSDLSRTLLYPTIGGYLMSAFIAQRFLFRFPMLAVMSPLNLMYMLLGASMLILVTIVMLGGLSYWNVDLLRVYDVRSQAASNLPGIFAYLSPLASKVFLPATFLLALLYRQRMVVVLALTGSFILFALTAHKDTLVYPIAVYFLHWLSGTRNPQLKLLSGYCVIIAISLVTSPILWGKDFLGNLIVRRIMLLPAQITYWYHDFFQGNTLLYWSQSKISFGMVDYPYPLDPAKMIGLFRYDVDFANLTTGWIGSGFMNAGILGIGIYAFVLGILMSCFNSVARVLDIRIVFAISFPAFITAVISADLPTALFNHGIIFTLLIFMLLNPRAHVIQQRFGRRNIRRRRRKRIEARP